MPFVKIKESPLVPDKSPVKIYYREAGRGVPLLVLHGERDDIVPCSHGRALLDAAPGPKQMQVFPGLGHNDLVPLAGAAWSEAIVSWWDGLESAAKRPQ